MSRDAGDKSFLPIVRLLTINIVVCACLLEIGLRVQQKLGPLYNLDLHYKALMPAPSETLNHAPQAATFWDDNGIRMLDVPNREPCNTRVLFLGDSFMQGVRPTREGDGYLPTKSSDTVPVQVRHFYRELTARNLCVFNAGLVSYAPSIYVPQAKRLIPLLRPDLVVIDIDESDIWDDFYRYRLLTVRDASGSISAVRPSETLVRFYRGLAQSTNKTSYIQRLVAKLYFTRVEFPRLTANSSRGRPIDNQFLARLSEAEVRKDHAAEIAYFKETLDDLTNSVISLMGGPHGLVYIHHPRLQHLRATGAVFNNIVAQTVAAVAADHHVRFYDATHDLKSAFGGEPEKYYFPKDVHFNPLGTSMYAKTVAQFLAGEPPKD